MTVIRRALVQLPLSCCLPTDFLVILVSPAPSSDSWTLLGGRDGADSDNGDETGRGASRRLLLEAILVVGFCGKPVTSSAEAPALAPESRTSGDVWPG